jgi:predicted RND superfamily exporter protein
MNHSNTKDIITIVVAILIALASLGTIGMLIIDSSTDAFIPQGDPVVKINEIIEGQFGSLDAINVGITVKDGTVFTKETLLLLESVTNQLEELDNVKQVISVTNSDHMSEGSDGFEVVSLYKPLYIA